MRGETSIRADRKGGATLSNAMTPASITQITLLLLNLFGGVATVDFRGRHARTSIDRIQLLHRVVILVYFQSGPGHTRYRPALPLLLIHILVAAFRRAVPATGLQFGRFPVWL